MISIIGAGPSGCFLAYKLAKAGFEVSIFEEHEKAGLPVQCTGLVTPNLFNLVPLKKSFIVNKFNSVKVIAPNNISAEIRVQEYLLDRKKFDNYFLEKALNAGAKIHLNHRFLTKSGQHAVLQNKNKIKKIKTKILIGADGPLSQVAKTANLYGKREFFIGMQATVQADFSKNTYQTFFGNIAPGFFAWIVPESSTKARIGLATRKNTRHYFENFLKNKGKVIEKQAGTIPIYNGKAAQKKNTYLIGDAATFCKATTGGGLVPGLQSAKILSDCIINKNNYESSLKKLRRQLWLHTLLRSTLDRFNTRDYNELVKQISNPRIKQQLSSNNRDSPITLLPKLLLAEPKLLYFSKCLLQKKV
ncbi:NAD(P)/FAD-dependent oxidoreductase [Candidatus Woesearchaeota archaeon]|nr:NAD(P)/FAD-dependent oxidoreductase [Candidatus Woesearchaeota archaeon]